VNVDQQRRARRALGRAGDAAVCGRARHRAPAGRRHEGEARKPHEVPSHDLDTAPPPLRRPNPILRQRNAILSQRIAFQTQKNVVLTLRKATLRQSGATLRLKLAPRVSVPTFDNALPMAPDEDAAPTDLKPSPRASRDRATSPPELEMDVDAMWADIDRLAE